MLSLMTQIYWGKKRMLEQMLETAHSSTCKAFPFLTARIATLKLGKTVSPLTSDDFIQHFHHIGNAWLAQESMSHYISKSYHGLKAKVRLFKAFRICHYPAQPSLLPTAPYLNLLIRPSPQCPIEVTSWCHRCVDSFLISHLICCLGLSSLL